jgi:hypothetical protein
MKNTLKSFLAPMVALACVVLGTSAGWAAIITINNPSFENDTLGDGGFTDNSFNANSWLGTSAGGFYFGALNPNSTDYSAAGGNSLPGPGTQGANVAYINNSHIWQVLGDTLVANSTYVLTGAIGHRQGLGYGTPSAQLIAGTTVLGTVNISDPGANNFAQWSLTYTSPSSGTLIGQTLEVLLANGSSSGQVNFDNIGLTVTAVPEPVNIALGIFGGAFLVVILARSRPVRNRIHCWRAASV